MALNNNMDDLVMIWGSGIWVPLSWSCNSSGCTQGIHWGYMVISRLNLGESHTRLKTEFSSHRLLAEGYSPFFATFHRMAYRKATGFIRTRDKSVGKRESPAGQKSKSYNLILEVTPHHLCHVLLVRSERFSPHAR